VRISQFAVNLHKFCKFLQFRTKFVRNFVVVDVQGPAHHHAAAPPLVDRCHFRVEQSHGAAMRALKQQSKALNRARKPPTTLQQGQCAGTMPIHSAGKLHQKLAATAGKTFLSKSTSLQAHACRGRPEQGREGSGRPTPKPVKGGDGGGSAAPAKEAPRP